MNSKTIVLFGATGTVGAYLSMDLYEQGYQVIAIGHRPFDNGFFTQYDIPYYSVDITKKETFGCLPNKNIYAVIHLAGAIPARMKGYNPQQYIDTIMTGTLNVLDYCVNCGADRIVFAQSIADVSYLYGTTNPIDADAPMKFPLNNDHSVYSICKTAAVHLIEHYSAKYGIKHFIMRFPNIYLYHPNPKYYVDGIEKWQSYRYLIERAKKGEAIEMWGNPDLKRDIVYVKDCNRMIISCLEKNSGGGIFNVGTGIGTTMRQQLEGIIEVFSPDGKKSKIIARPEMPDSPEYIMDISKSRRELGYEPKYDYIAYLKDMKEEMEKQRFALLWGRKS